MKKLFIVALVFLSISCTSSFLPVNVIKNIQSVELGMTKDEVIGVMGKHYILNANSLNEKGESEQTIAYPLSEQDEFRLKFINNTLISWDRFIVRETISLHKKSE